MNRASKVGAGTGSAKQPGPAENGKSTSMSHRERFSGRRYTLLRGLRIVFEDAPVAAVIGAAAALAAGAATGPLLVLATERFIATALDVAGGGLPFAAIAMPVFMLLALFAVEVLQTAIRGLTDARIEMRLRSGFRIDLTEKRARLEYRHLESPATADLLRRVAAGPQMESQPTPERGPVKQAFDDVVGLAAVAVRVIGIAVVLARLSWWIVPAVLAVAVPFVLLGIRGGQRAYELERRVARQRRRATYLSEEVLQGRDPAAERALFGYSDYVKRRWRTVFDAVVRLRLPGHKAAGAAGDQLRTGSRPPLRPGRGQRSRQVDHRQADARVVPADRR